MRAARIALEQIRNRQPQSMLPDLEPRADAKVRPCLYSEGFDVRFADEADDDSNNPGAQGTYTWGWSNSSRRRRPRLTLSLLDQQYCIGSEVDEIFLPATARLPSFLHDDSTDKSFDLQLVNDPAVAEHVEDAGLIGFRLQQPPGTEAAAFTGKLGTLGFCTQLPATATYLRYESERGEYSYLRIGQRSPISNSPDKPPPVAVVCRLRLNVSSIEPVTVPEDPQTRRERPRPLLISRGRSIEENDTGFVLVATESIGDDRNRLLSAEILPTKESESKRGDEYIVLSEQPFAVTLFQIQPLADRSSAENNTVAVFNSDQGFWEFKRASSSYHYIFPPQVVGESMDKPRRLEIVDLEPTDEPSGAAPIRPLPGNNALKRRAVEFRLSPSAEIWVEPSDLERGYFLPEWATFELFRQRGDFGPGVALQALRGEFLYGLPVSVSTELETGAARSSRVSEIETLVGRPVGLPDASSPDDELFRRWKAVSRAIERRPERLDLWTRSTHAGQFFPYARFADSARFALRETALHRFPVASEENDADIGKPPRTLPGIEGKQPRFHPQGLSGGALWPIESPNLLRAISQSPAARGGELSRVALSPLGGDADQAGEFLNGIVTISSETRQGFVQRQKLEVLGRISVLWHRAKHVIVYERTTSASLQFTPLDDDNGDKSLKRTRRPVLRKVREYIEILEPERSYPDFEQVPRRTTGCLEKVCCNSRIINVDSFWGRDIEDYGYEIPLWNRGEAERRPRVYPKPDIAFVTAAEGDEDKPVVAQECREPDQLFFFADVSAKTSDTDRWSARTGIDCAALPHPKQVSKLIDASGTDIANFENRTPNVSRVLPGYRRFTWQLAPAARKTMINAGRGAKPLYVGLESVTFMRSGVRDESLTAELEEAIRTGRNLARSSEDRSALDALGYWKADGSGVPESLKVPAKTLDDFIKKISSDVSETELKAAHQTFIESLTSGTWGQLEAAQTNIRNLVPSDKLRPFTAPDKLCERLGSDAIGNIKRKKRIILENIRSWEAEANQALDPTDWTKAEVVKLLLEEVYDLLEPAFDAASQDIGDLNKGVEDARAMLRDVRSEIARSLQRTRSRLQEFHASYDRSKPWSPARLAAYSAKLETMLSSVEQDIFSAIEELRVRCATELGDAAQALGGHISDATAAVSRRETTLLRYTPSTANLGKLLDKGKGQTDPNQFDKYRRKLEVVQTKVEEITDEDLQKLVTNALSGIKVYLDTLEKTAEAGLTALEDAKNADAYVEAVKTLFNGAQDDLQKLSKELDKTADLAGKLLEGKFYEAHQAVAGTISEPIRFVRSLAAMVKQNDVKLGEIADAQLAYVETLLEETLQQADRFTDEAFGRLDAAAEDIEAVLASTRNVIEPQALLRDVLLPQVFRPAIERVLSPLPDDLTDRDEGDRKRDIRNALRGLSYDLEDRIEALDNSLLDTVAALETACKTLSGDVEAVYDYFSNELDQTAKKLIKDRAKEFQGLLDAAEWDGAKLKDAEEFLRHAKAISAKVRAVHNDLSRSYESARVYGDRVLDQAGRMTSGGVTSVPNNIIKLYSAATSSPELAALKANADRLRGNFDELKDIIDTSGATALFNRLGDDLKALGISFPVKQWADQLLPDNLEKLDIGKVLNNFGGMDLKGLFKNIKLPKGADEIIKISSDFNKKQLRAWVQADIDVPLPKRSTLFSIGVFKLDFVSSRMRGEVKLEASEDTDAVKQTGFALIDTTLQAIVSGQTMVTIEKVRLQFTKEDGLQVELDPRNIRLNPAFQFIQDTLGTLFADEIGGMKIIKEGGVPVGVEHCFSLPPISLMFGTSGVSNIAISNRFSLVAFPDFIIGNRFNLSRPDMPFIFSIFILGGTGYIQVDTEYRPAKAELSVLVTAAAGASAALGFSFGVISGSVYITLSVVLSYRKVIGAPGGGLSVGSSLLIAGNVRVASIATVYITLLLNMTYRDTGAIDATGTLTVTVKISRWFKIRARARAKYQLRGGVSRTQVSTETNTEIEKKKLKKAKAAADRLSRARNSS